MNLALRAQKSFAVAMDLKRGPDLPEESFLKLLHASLELALVDELRHVDVRHLIFAIHLDLKARVQVVGHVEHLLRQAVQLEIVSLWSVAQVDFKDCAVSLNVLH